jgi:hypothetical protein
MKAWKVQFQIISREIAFLCAQINQAHNIVFRDSIIACTHTAAAAGYSSD